MSRVYKRNNTDTGKWYLFTILFLLVDYGRPQDFLPIAALRPAMILILILCFYIVTNNGLVKSKSNQTILIWLFIALLTIHVPFATNNYWAYITALGMIMYMPYIISVIVLVNNFKRLKMMINVNLVLMVYISLYGITHGGKGSGNYFIDENDISLYINMWLPFCFFLMLSETRKNVKLLYLLALAVGLAVVVASFSRGGFVGLVAVSFVIWLFSPKKALSLALICIAAIVLYLSTGDEYKREMLTVTDTTDSTADARLESWSTAWDMFLDNPLGVGGRNFAADFSQYQGERFSRGMWGRAAHSLWFTLIPELGIIGIIIYLKLMHYNLRDIFYVKKIETNDDPKLIYLHSLSLAFIASLVGFFVSATFISVLYYPHYWYITGLIVATSRITKQYIGENGRLLEKEKLKV